MLKETSFFTSYSVNFRTRNRPEKFRGFRETRAVWTLNPFRTSNATLLLNALYRNLNTSNRDIILIYLLGHIRCIIHNADTKCSLIVMLDKHFSDCPDDRWPTYVLAIQLS